MRGFAAVFSREFGEWRMLLPASLVAGLLPFAFALIPGFGAPAADVRDAGAFFLAAILCGLATLFLGGSIPARDLADGRMGFYFSRPVSPWAIWAGRLGAILSLVLLAWLLVFLPSTLAGGGLLTLFERHSFSGPIPAGTLLPILAVTGFFLFMTLAAQTLSLFLASRSPWLALDVLLLAACATACGFSLNRLYTLGGSGAFRFGCLGLAALVLLALLAAGAASSLLGRADIQRARKAAAWALWPILLASALSLEGYSRWYVSPGIGSLRAIDYGIPAPTGPWVFIGGATHLRFSDFSSQFLLNTRTGHSVRIPGAAWSLAFSADGTRCAQMQTPVRYGSVDPEVTVYDLTQPSPSPRKTGITIPEGWANLVLSADGRILAAFHENRFEVHNLEAKRVLYAQTAPGSIRFTGRFLGPHKLRLYRWKYDNLTRAEGEVTLLDLDLATRALTETGRLEEASPYNVRGDASGERLLVLRGRDSQESFALHDGTTGALLATLAEGIDHGSGTFTSAGEIVLAYDRGPGSPPELALYRPDGGLERRVALPQGEQVLLAWEFAPGRLAAARPAAGASMRPGSATTLELPTMALKPPTQKLSPFYKAGFRFGNLSRGPMGPGSIGTQLFLDERGGLITWTPTTGESRVILKGA